MLQPSFESPPTPSANPARQTTPPTPSSAAVQQHHQHHLSSSSSISDSPSSASAMHSRQTSIASTVASPHSPSHSNALASSSSSPHLVLHGNELVAFTRALQEMLRTNHVRATRQAAINETNSQLHAMNFFLHYCNAERSQKLEREYASVRDSIENGRILLSQMSEVIASQDAALNELGQEVVTLNERADQQNERVNDMEDALVEQKNQLHQAMHEYEARLQAQEAEFRRQEQVLAKLLSVRFRMDFACDMLILLLSWYGSHNTVTGLVLNFLSRNVFFRDGGRRTVNRRARNFIGTVQFLAFLIIVYKMRAFAREKGLHHAIGSYSKYFQFAARTTGTAVDMIRGGGSAAMTLDQEEEERKSNHDQLSAPVVSASGALEPVPPEYSTSAAASLGRHVGSAMLATLSAGRNSLRFVLNHIVGTGASRDMDFDNFRQQPTSHAASSTTASSSSSSSSSSSHSQTSSPQHEHEHEQSHEGAPNHLLAPPPLSAPLTPGHAHKPSHGRTPSQTSQTHSPALTPQHHHQHSSQPYPSLPHQQSHSDVSIVYDHPIIYNNNAAVSPSAPASYLVDQNQGGESGN